MSATPIQCRECGNTLAKHHHSGNIKIERGVPVVLLRDGRVQVQCPCGDTRVIVPDRMKTAA